MNTRRKTTSDKIRVTLDLTPQFYERLQKLEQLTEAGTKANLIRQALQLYEYVAQKTIDGYSFRAVKNGDEETLVFLGAAPPLE